MKMRMYKTPINNKKAIKKKRIPTMELWPHKDLHGAATS
jgi:hypothetical protein